MNCMRVLLVLIELKVIEAIKLHEGVVGVDRDEGD